MSLPHRLPVVAALVVTVLLGLVGGPADATDSAPYLSDAVPVAPGCIVLDPDWVGVKVYLVQRRLGVTDSRERYDSATVTAVRDFQRGHGLRVNGRVNRTTWRALDLGRSFCMDRFTVQPTVGAGTDRAHRVEAMIRWARKQLDRPYIWGGAGPVGYDCSGLVLQGVHAGGLVVPTITTYLHQQADFRSASAFYASSLKHVPLAQRRRGDLVFWSEGSSITHVAIYLGSDRILEAVRPSIRRASLWTHALPLMPKVVRPFTVGQARG